MSKRHAVIILSIVCILLVAVGYVGFRSRKADEVDSENVGRTQEDRYVTYQGKQYVYNYDLKNILFIGVDKPETISEQEVGKGGQADVLILMSMNKEDKTTTLLEISRDSMTDIKIYDMNGEYLDTERAQIALQYAYGDGAKKSCRLTKEAVSNLLYEIPISSHIALGVDGIKAVTDALGGVELTVPKDYTDINPLFEQGASIVMNGEQAEQYIRSRDLEVTGSNNQRMERQTQFMEALAVQLQGRDIDWYQRVFNQIEDYVVTDISLQEMERLSEFQLKEPIEVVPGEVHAGEKHDEFTIDNEKLQELVIKLFYKEVE